jgi:hypothetical protein
MIGRDCWVRVGGTSKYMQTMPEAVVGWCAHCWACWGGIGGRKFDIWEEMIYYTPIWDVLVPEGTREGAGEHLTTGTRSRTVPIRQVVPVGLPQARFCSWARWAPFFIRKKVYYS